MQMEISTTETSGKTSVMDGDIYCLITETTTKENGRKTNLKVLYVLWKINKTNTYSAKMISVSDWLPKRNTKVKKKSKARRKRKKKTGLNHCGKNMWCNMKGTQTGTMKTLKSMLIPGWLKTVSGSTGRPSWSTSAQSEETIMKESSKTSDSCGKDMSKSRKGGHTGVNKTLKSMLKPGRQKTKFGSLHLTSWLTVVQW